MIKPIIYDIEVFGGMFLFCAMNPETNEKFSFELSRRKDEVLAMLKFIETHKDYWFVGFNNLKYDAQVVEHIRRKYPFWSELSHKDILEKIKDFSNDVIEAQDYEEWSPYRERDLFFKQLDLVKIHHFDNKHRRAALKWIAFMIDAEDIEELPFPHYQIEFTDEELEQIIAYCWKDISNTHKFYLYTRGETDNEVYKGKDKVQDRLDLIESLGFPTEAINFSDVKIGDEINKRGYCSIKGITEKQLMSIRKQRKGTRKLTFGDCIPDYVSFKTDTLKDFLERVKPEKVKMSDSSKQEFHVELNGTHYVIARGGIHTKDKPRIIIPKPHEKLEDADVGSQHPTTIAKRGLYPDHLGPEWLVNYRATIRKRMEFKELGHTNRRYKGLADTYKLALNGGGFGKTIDKTNWQYGPEVGFSCTIGNQFEILMLAEMMEIEGIHVVSANTDGILCLYNRDLESKYYEVCRTWEEIVGNTVDGKLEFVEFSKFVQESSGHYIAVKKKDNSLKVKGRFSTDGEVNKNNTKDLGRIERKAIVRYFYEGVPLEKTIKESRNIYDFFIGLKSTSDFHYETVSRKGEAEVYKKIIRFYVSNEGVKLLKIKNEDSESNGADMTKICDGYLVTIMNSVVHKPWHEYDINYDYYIEKARAIVSRLEGQMDTAQLSLF